MWRPSPGGSGLGHGCRASCKEGVVFLLQLVVDGVLHDVLDDRSPSGHLVGLFGDAFLPGNLVGFAAAGPSLWMQVFVRRGYGRRTEGEDVRGDQE